MKRLNLFLTLALSLAATHEAMAQNASTDTQWTDEEIAAATLVCRKIDENTYAFVNNEGKYFIWRGGDTGGSSNGCNNNTGYKDSYDTSDTTATDITVAKMDATATNVSAEQEDLFGYMTLSGKRKTGATAYFVMKSEGYDGANAPYYNDTYSSAILIEDATYPNTVTPATTNNSIGGFTDTYIATFSAPFPTVIPEGANAHYIHATATEDNVLLAKIQPITDQAIPANTGVLISSTANDKLTLVPATTETTTDITESNMLGNSAGAPKVIAETDYAYILAIRNSKTAFFKGKVGSTIPMNRSYLVYNGDASAISLNFDGAVTGIENAVENVLDAEAPLYDISGRRVTNAAKGGVYIRNGKKILLK